MKNMRRCWHIFLLSLREKTGQQLLSKALKRQIRHDLDPTLLLPPDKWMNFVSERPHNRDYIFTYLLPEREDVLQSVEKFAREKNCDIYWVRKGIRGKKGFHILTMLSPEQFLNYLYHAKYVVTGSFHALCFSIIYQKEFYYTMSSAAERSVRLVDLAEDLGITNRKLRNGVQNTDPIPYDEIATQLEQKRAQSMQTIRVICEQ